MIINIILQYTQHLTVDKGINAEEAMLLRMVTSPSGTIFQSTSQI